VTNPSRSALVLFSGGQDSTASLAWCAQPLRAVATIGFDYGQRHVVELECRLAVRAHLHPSSRTGMRGSATTTCSTSRLRPDLRHRADRERADRDDASGLPNTFVPGRNLLFFTLRRAVAYRRGLNVLVGGMCETDFSGYPDCRDNTLKSLQVSLSLGMDTPMTLETPLMWLDKAQTWALTAALGGEPLTQLVVEHTHTCYLGERTQRHEWGYGCGQCPACALRARGYRAWRAHGDEPFMDTAVDLTGEEPTLQAHGASALPPTASSQRREPRARRSHAIAMLPSSATAEAAGQVVTSARPVEQRIGEAARRRRRGVAGSATPSRPAPRGPASLSRSSRRTASAVPRQQPSNKRTPSSPAMAVAGARRLQGLVVPWSTCRHWSLPLGHQRQASSRCAMSASARRK
jgi:7-cyano-7-deazaguanine synthase